MNNFDERSIVHVESGNHGTPNRVFINGVEINNLVAVSITADAEISSLSKVTLEFYADDITYESTIKEVRL